MQHPRDIRRPHPGVHQAKVDARLNTIEANATNIRNNFVGHTRALETKVKHLEDRARTQRDESDHIVDIVGHLESDVSDLDNCYSDVVPRLDAIELEVEVMNKVVTKNALALCEIEERIAIMQEKIDGIN